MEAAREFIQPVSLSSQKPKQQSLSSQLWGIDWVKELAELPSITAASGISYRIEYGTFAEIETYLQKHFSTELSQMFNYPENTQVKAYKRKFYSEMSDCFIARETNGEMISFLIGNLQDWSSYYSRFAMTLPSKKGSKAYANISSAVFEILKKHSVQRVLSEISPANKSRILYHSQDSFYLTGNTQSDRWGTMLNATAYLDPDCESIFLSKFGGPILTNLSKNNT